MHTLLRPVALGLPPHPWTMTALPFLVASSALCAVFYSPSFFRGKGVSMNDLFWIQRMNPKTGQDSSGNLLTGENIPNLAPTYKSKLLRTSVEVCWQVYYAFK